MLFLFMTWLCHSFDEGLKKNCFLILDCDVTVSVSCLSARTSTDCIFIEPVSVLKLPLFKPRTLERQSRENIIQAEASVCMISV